MQYLFVLFIFATISACAGSPDQKLKNDQKRLADSKEFQCDVNYDSLLVKYAGEFTANSIDLKTSISQDLKSFLLKVDTNCLRRQSRYRYFISEILMKLSLYHLECCHQHYDLYQMRNGSALIIIDDFDRIYGFKDQTLEMLNSGLIVDYVLSDSVLSSTPDIKILVEKKMKIEKEIKESVF